MRLRALQITQLPGIDEPFTVAGPLADINLIHGPNASGKSSLLRALGYLLAPAAGDPPDLVLRAELDAGSDRWQVSRTGRQVKWQCNGDPAAPPPLPDRDTLQSYLLQVDGLMALTSTDRNLADVFRRELAGGYDLPALRETFIVQPRLDRSAGGELAEAERRLRAAERANQALVERQARLPALERDIEAARQASVAVTRSEEALKLLTFTAQLQEARIELAAFPAKMPADDCPERLERLLQRQTELQQRRVEIEAARQQARTALAETGLADAAFDEATVAAANAWLNQLRTVHAQLATADAQRQAATARASESAAALGVAMPENRLPITPDLAGRIEERANDVHEAARALAERQALVASAAEDGHAVAAAGRWLDLAAAVAALAGALWLTVTGWTVSIAASLAGSVLVVSGVAALLRAHLRRAADDDTLARRSQRQLQAAADELARAERELATVAQQAGLAGVGRPSADAGGRRYAAPLELHLFVQRLLRFDDDRRVEAAAIAQHQSLTREHDALRQRLAEFVARWHGALAASDVDSLAAGVEALQIRIEAARTRARDVAECDRELSANAHSLAQVQDEVDRLYADLDLRTGDRDALLARCRDVARWQEVRQRLQVCQAKAEAARQRLDGADELLALVDAADTAAIEERMRRAESAAASLQDLMAERAAIIAAIEQARREQPLDARRAAQQTARDVLDERFERRMRAEAAHFLLNEIEAEHRSAHQPEALRRADENLRQFTHDRFTLELDPAGHPCARDTGSGQRRTLNELSVGTRMQLLIALRVAWAEQHERQGPALPLFLDEALTTSDPERFEAVATALAGAAARTRRQIFYLTAQAEDAERWRRATGHAPHVIDLAALRRSAGGAAAPLPLAEVPRVPAPDDHDPERWARQIAVTPVAPYRDVGAIHLFHVLRDDLALLHRLLDELRIETVGQLASFLAQSPARRHLSAAHRAMLETRIAIARAWYQAWHVGRGRPLDRAALERSPAGNWQTLDALAERAAQVAGDAQAFVASLDEARIPGIGAGRIETLAAWLGEHGYSSTVLPLDATARYHRALAAASGDAESTRRIVHWLESAAGIEAPN